MEEDATINLLRMTSEDSTATTISCEYYRTDIFEQLPSTLRSRMYMDKEQESETDWEDHSHQYRAWDPTQELKTLPFCMQEKRNLRGQRNITQFQISNWESWQQSQEKARRRMREHLVTIIAGLLPWKHTLHKIEGRFGVGVKAYFVFLRYLLCLNILNCHIIGCVVVAFLYNGSETTCSHNNSDYSVLDIFLGSGFMELSPVFYGFYSISFSGDGCSYPPLIFFCGMIIILFLSFFMIVRRTVVGYKHVFLAGNNFKMNVSYKVFCGWDFCIQDPQAAALKHSFIRNELKMDLEEQKFRQRILDRSLKQWIYLYLLRFVLNFIVLILLGGAISLIWFATIVLDGHDIQSEVSWIKWIWKLMLGYLPPFAITLVNFVLPHIFSRISAFEDYALATQLNVTLVRSILLKFGSLAVYLFFLITAEPPNGKKQMQEIEFGKNMYKLTIFQLLACCCNTFLVAYPRKLVLKKWPRSKLARKVGHQQFEISLNVLDLVYSQTITWVGVFYCPLLPAISIFKLLIIFYLKKYIVVQCCIPAQKMFRTSSSSVLFHFMLLMGLILSAVTLGFNITRFEEGGCGPFPGNHTVFNVTKGCIDTLPGAAQAAIHYIGSEAFMFILILAEIIILTFYVSRRRANQKTIERLMDMLVTSSSDKRFLVKEHATLLRKRRVRNAGRAASAKD